MNTARALLAALFLVALCAAPAPAQTADPATGIEQAGTMGGIDWLAGRAVATGTGAPPAQAANAAQARIAARRAAVLDARRNLLEVVRQIRIDSATRVDNLIVTGDVVLSRVEGALVQAQIVSETPLADGSWRVTVAVPLAGNLSRAVLDAHAQNPAPQPLAAPPAPTDDARVRNLERRVAALEQTLAALIQNLRARPAQTAAAPKPPAQPESPAPAPPAPAQATAAQAAAPAPPLPPADTAAASAATGLVVDARGTGFTPSLKPRIVSGDTVLYPAPSADFETGVSRGFARYYRDLAQAQQSPRAGTTPHTIRATANGADLEVSPQDAALLQAILKKPGNILDQCNLTIVF